jgi:hypothetical protein
MRLLKVFVLTLLLASVTRTTATERVPNLYKTHKLSTNSVVVSCDYNLVPSVKKLDGPFVIVTCEVVR